MGKVRSTFNPFVSTVTDIYIQRKCIEHCIALDFVFTQHVTRLSSDICCVVDLTQCVGRYATAFRFNNDECLMHACEWYAYCMMCVCVFVWVLQITRCHHIKSTLEYARIHYLYNIISWSSLVWHIHNQSMPSTYSYIEWLEKRRVRRFSINVE